VTSQVLKSVLE